MYRYILTLFAAILLGVSFSSAQVPTTTMIEIVKAEDARRFDKVLEDLIKSPDLAVRDRAALAAGRIGDDRAIPALVELLETEAAIKTAAMAAFAIGEIESVKGADAILKTLKDPATTNEVRARAVEAAGKIAAANAKDPKAKELGNAINATLESEYAKAAKFDRETVLLGLTALLRVRPEGADVTAAHFLTSPDARVRADAGNTMTRIKAKNANPTLRKMLASDTDPIARANAARALGAADDNEAVDVLVKAATSDGDQRVRVSAIRALAALKDSKAASPLLQRGKILVSAYKSTKFRIPAEQSELLEIFIAGRKIINKPDQRWSDLFQEFVRFDQLRSSDAYVANASNGASSDQVAPKPSGSPKMDFEFSDWRQYSTMAQIYGAAATFDAITDQQKYVKKIAPGLLLTLGAIEPKPDPKLVKAGPDVLRAYAEYKTDELGEVLLQQFESNDVFLRATAAELLSDQPASKENVGALKKAFDMALVKDKMYDDAQLAIMDALYKLDKKESVGTLLVALSAPDYLVRKKAFDLLSDKELQKDFPGIPISLENARAKHKDQVLPYSPAFGTKLGQVLNTDADYRRAVMRKNGSVKAVLKTEKGTFTIVFNPEEAPLTVDNFIKLARSGYFNGLEVHRVVPNFVMQDGDPRGDGNGGPGWSIRCEINMLPYDRGAVGMALSGKDTGGSQWFVTLSPQPHLDGGYTVFGHVNETDMKIVDSIVRGDKILNVKIIGR